MASTSTMVTARDGKRRLDVRRGEWPHERDAVACVAIYRERFAVAGDGLGSETPAWQRDAPNLACPGQSPGPADH